MTKAFLNNTLAHAVGTAVNGSTGEFLGQIPEVTQDITGESIKYLILESSVFFGEGRRFFAITASPPHVFITKEGKIVLQMSKDDIQFAKGISADKCPKPDLKFSHAVYELYKL